MMAMSSNGVFWRRLENRDCAVDDSSAEDDASAAASSVGSMDIK
jgi:hypothetical protein